MNTSYNVCKIISCTIILNTFLGFENLTKSDFFSWKVCAVWFRWRRSASMVPSFLSQWMYPIDSMRYTSSLLVSLLSIPIVSFSSLSLYFSLSLSLSLSLFSYSLSLRQGKKHEAKESMTLLNAGTFPNLRRPVEFTQSCVLIHFPPTRNPYLPIHPSLLTALNAHIKRINSNKKTLFPECLYILYNACINS